MEDGNNEYIKMSNSEAKIKDIWEELIVKETLKAILAKLEEDKSIIRQIIREELTEMWNNSEIPIFKQILKKLVPINNYVKDKNPIKEEDNETEGEEKAINETKKEVKAINIMDKGKEPIIMDMSKSKPKLTTGVKRGIESLAELHKLGKF